MSTRQEVWEAAQAADLGEFITKVSSVFGKGFDVAIEAGGEVYETRPGMMAEGQNRVVPGTGAEERRRNPCGELKAYMKECREFSANPRRRTLRK